MTLKDGRRIAAPLWWRPRLLDATPEQRANWAIMPFGDAIEWPEIDEHVSIKGPPFLKHGASRTLRRYGPLLGFAFGSPNLRGAGPNWRP
jgi:hypothetical protein